ncbi:MAG: 2-dehydropantoate 2-reductase [Hydrogenothermaceae bacterium]
MKKVVVIGLGAVGTVFATFLKKIGHTVYGVVKENQLKSFNEGILKVDGIWGIHQAKLDKVLSDVKQIQDEDIDLVIVAVKSYDTEEASKSIKDIIKDKTVVLLTQNGYGNYEKASKYIPKEKILLGRIIFGSKVNSPGYATVTVNADDVRIGHPENLLQENEIVETVCLIKHSGIPASYSKEIYKVLWDKILYNCALNPLGAILHKRYGELAENSDTVNIMNTVIEEIFKVCKFNNIPLNYKSAQEYIEHFYKNLIPPTKAHYPSMYYDLKSGKKTEIDALNGAIVDLGKKVGYIPVVNLTLTTIVKNLEKLREFSE